MVWDIFDFRTELECELFRIWSILFFIVYYKETNFTEEVDPLSNTYIFQNSISADNKTVLLSVCLNISDFLI